ncbi:hypothetical protein [Paenibacillus wynnii]|nr:hypothetical protein [Paenibacillus wynnii]MDQ0196177.1 hypothetical protein [Paenibacillus wynnii]
MRRLRADGRREIGDRRARSADSDGNPQTQTVALRTQSPTVGRRR